MYESGTRVKTIENRPVLLPGMDFYLGAYRQLQHDRPVGMVVGPIPWTSVIKWCQLHEIYDINDIETVLRYIRAMERVEYDFDERKQAAK